ncbi:MAG: DUF3352 domain-containing protein [Cyanobacteria bacterium P01_F01_bin.143]
MSSNKFRIAKLSMMAIAIAIVGGCFIYAKGWHQLIFAKKLTPITGAELIPDEAIMTSFISTDIDNWQKLQQVGLPSLDKLFKDQLPEIEADLADLEINYQQDIQPWIGNSLIALIPTEDSSQNIEELHSLAIIGIKDPLKAINFLKKMQAQSDVTVESTTYKGQSITTSTDATGKILHTALLGNKLAIAQEINILEIVIDTYQGEPSLISSDKTKEIFQQKSNINNSLAQVYFPNYARIMAAGLQDSELSENTREIFQGIESFSLGIGTEDNKIKVQLLTKLDPEIIASNNTKTPGKVVTQLPEKTLAFVNSQGINDVWSELSVIASQEPELKSNLDGLRQSTKFITGLDLDRDIFAWMDGEFALAIVPSSHSNIPGLNMGLGGALLVETSDRGTAQNTINQLDTKFQQSFGIASQKINQGKSEAIQWSIPDSNLALSSGWVDKNNLLFAFGNKDIKSLYDSRKSPLTKNPKFQEIAKNLPKKNLGYFYLDIEPIMQKMGPFLLRQDPTFYDAVSVLNSIKAIGGTSTMTDQETSQTDMIILFK